MTDVDVQLVQAVTTKDIARATTLLQEEYASIESVDGQNRTLARIAVENDDAGMLRLLYDEGADLDEASNSVNLLDLACQRKAVAVIAFLLEDEFNLSENLERMLTGRMYETLDVLVGCMEDVDVLDDDEWKGQSPLQLACSLGDKTAAEIFLKHGADVNFEQRDGSGRTPLHKAALCLHVELMELLLAHGADIDATDSRNETPLCYLTSKVPYKTEQNVTPGFVASYELLLQHGASFNYGYHAERFFLEDMPGGTFEFFIKDQFARDGGKKVQEETGSTLLRWAITQHQASLTEWLLKKGVDANAGGMRAPLLEAFDRIQPDIVKLLLAQGADPLVIKKQVLEEADRLPHTPMNEQSRKQKQEMIALLSTYW